MRKLNKKQRELLKKWYNEHKKEVGLFFDVANCDNFSYELYNQLEDLNDFEIINSAINHYIVNCLDKSKI